MVQVNDLASRSAIRGQVTGPCFHTLVGMDYIKSEVRRVIKTSNTSFTINVLLCSLLLLLLFYVSRLFSLDSVVVLL